MPTANSSRAVTVSCEPSRPRSENDQTCVLGIDGDDFYRGVFAVGMPADGRKPDPYGWARSEGYNHGPMMANLMRRDLALERYRAEWLVSRSRQPNPGDRNGGSGNAALLTADIS
jgi:hypothetical protein